jgi:L-amino acid N-acyltransferase YncA
LAWLSDMSGEVTIRAARKSDAPALLDIYAPYVRDTAITFEYDVPTADEFAGRIHNVLTRYPYLVAECGGNLLGYAYASPFHSRAAYSWAVETSIYVRCDRRQLGIGRRLYDELERALSAQGILNLNACIAFPETEDEHLTRDSVRFHDRLGYRMVGEFHKCGYKFGRWYGMVWMEKLIGEHEAAQPPVKNFCEVRKELGL